MLQHQRHRKTHHNTDYQRNTKHLQLTTRKWVGRTKKNTPILSRRPTTPTFAPAVEIRPSASNMTIATASLSRLSPKMIVNSFGSTLYVLNMAITVTGSVADKVAPSWSATGRGKAESDSSPIFVHSQTRTLYQSVPQRENRLPYNDGRYECPCKRKCENAPNISEKVCLH